MAGTPDGLSARELTAYQGNVAKIQIYQFLTNMSFWMPIWILFLQAERHLTLTEITAMTGISWLMTALAEVPTGAVADAYGRKVSVALGTAIVAAGTLLFGILPNYWGIMGAFLIWSVGLALQSGADMAMLYDSMRVVGNEAAYPKTAGRSFAIIQFAQGAAAVAGGWLAGWFMSLPMLITSLLSVVAVAVVLSLREPPAEHKQRRNYWETLSGAARFVGENRGILYLMLFTSVFGGVAWAVTFVLFQPYMEHRVHVAWVGVLFMLLRVAGTLGSMYGPKLIKVGALQAWLVAAPLAFIGAFVVLGTANTWWLGFSLMLIVGFMHGGVRPLLSAALNQRVTGAVRATLLSLQSLVFSLFIAGLQPLLGAVTDLWGLVAAFLALAGLSTLLLVLRPLWQRSEQREMPAAPPVEVRN